MSEAKSFKIERARRIASVSAMETNAGPKSCIPLTVAFTHGYSDQEFSDGLHEGAFIFEVDSASDKLAERHDETVTKLKILVKNTDQVLSEIEPVLDKSRATWLTYNNDKEGHILGVLNEGDDKFLVYDAAELERYSGLNSKELANRIAQNHTTKQLYAYVFGFKKK